MSIGAATTGTQTDNRTGLSAAFSMAPATSTAAAATPTGAIPPAASAASANTTSTSRDSTLTHGPPPAATTRAHTLSRFRDRRPLTLSDVLLLRDAPPSLRPRAGCFGVYCNFIV